MANEIKNTVVSATRWSVITEIVAKLVSPVSFMILARLLTPDAFGVMVTANLIISFAEIFTDAGFQKYLIQHEFENKKSLFEATSVAFWTNLVFSLIIWTIIVFFSDSLARLVGNDGNGLVIAISCICIPLAAFSSIQMALYKRNFDFRTLFIVRIAGILVPLLVTIPVAILTHSYWALVVGTIAQNLFNAIILTIRSEWKPKWFYDFAVFKNMFSFTAWSMIEAVSIWLTGYLDVFIVGTVLSTHYMGLYRTSINAVGQIMAVVTASTTPVLFSALSRLQGNNREFINLFFRFQKIVGLLVIPLGVGIFIFSDVITEILLGDNWSEASYFIGWWGLTSSITIVLSHYCSEVYRSLGKPKISFYSQVLHLCFLIPAVLISVKHGFQCLCLVRSLIRFSGICINLVFLYHLCRISPRRMLKNVMPSCFAAFVMFLVSIILPQTENLIYEIGYILLCTLIYLIIVLQFNEERTIIKNLPKILKTR